MSRLDEFILRMQAQRACIDDAARRVRGRAGPVLEVGLGNGRTYDHLRLRFPQREIFVFDREVAAHPDCVPQPELIRLGDFRASIPAYELEGQLQAVFIHADVGSANRVASARLAADLAPSWLAILARDAYLACDQLIDLDGLTRLPLPGQVVARNYHFYQRTA